MKFRAPRRSLGDPLKPPPDKAGVFHCPKSDSEERHAIKMKEQFPASRRTDPSGWRRPGSSTPSPTWSATATASMSSATATDGSRWTTPSGCTARGGSPSRSRAAATRCRQRVSGSWCGRTGSGRRSHPRLRRPPTAPLRCAAPSSRHRIQELHRGGPAVPRHGAGQADRKRRPPDFLRAHGLGPGRAG